MLSDRETEITRNPIDWVGLFFLAFGLACLQVMLDKGQDLDWFESNVIITLCVFSICSIAYFIVWNYYEKFPIVDFSFFCDRNFTLGTFVTTIGYLIYFGSTVTVPLWLQTQMNYDAYWAGVAVAPVGIFPVIFSAWIGKNLYRVDLRAVSSLSFFLFAIAFFYQSNFTPQVSLEMQAYVLSTNDMSWLAAWIFILMIPIPFICNKVSMNHPGSVAAE